MKRVAITLEDVAAYDNLAYAAYRAARGSFCGYRITPGQLRLSRRRQRRYQQFRQHWEQAYSAGLIDVLTLQHAYDAVHAITLPADSLSWRRHNLKRYPTLDV